MAVQSKSGGPFTKTNYDANWGPNVRYLLWW